MTPAGVNQFNNIQDNLLFWIKQFIATKVYIVKEKKEITKDKKNSLHVKILNSKDIDELREHTREARREGLYNLPDNLNPLYKFYKHIEADVKIANIKKIDTTYTSSYVENGLAENTSKTQELHYDQIKSLFKFIENNNSEKHRFNIGYLRSGKKATSPIDKSKPKKQTYLEPEELIEFLRRLKDCNFTHPNKFQPIVMIKFLCFAGIRKEELVNLKRKDICKTKIEKEVYLKILVHGKGNKERLVYIKYSLIKKDYLAFMRIRLDTETDSEYLFITRNGKEYSHRTIEDLLRRVFESTRFDNRGLSAHSLRRSMCTYLYSEGVRIEYISKLMGHSSEEMTETYIFLSEQKKYEIVDLLENI